MVEMVVVVVLGREKGVEGRRRPTIGDGRRVDGLAMEECRVLGNLDVIVLRILCSCREGRREERQQRRVFIACEKNVDSIGNDDGIQGDL